ncbi:TPA: hypothetical protein ACX6SZ_003674 [Photobacterium damselae]
MKILIYGEFSGFGKSLAHGFEQLGWHSSVFSPNGDSFKKIDSSFTLKSKNVIGKVIELIMLIPTLGKYEKILIMNPSFFSIFKGIGILPLIYFILKKKEMYLICCGDDVEYIKSGKEGIVKKYIYTGVKYPSKNYFKRPLDIFVSKLCAKYSKLIIPVMYDYEVAWKESVYSNKVTKVIPLACLVSPKPAIKPIDYKKIQILHGINRPSVKGTDVILKVLKRIENEYDNVKVHTPERLTQQEYLSLFSEIDISIDQCKCHGYGMNAIYSMMHGHIVLAPADNCFNESLNIKNNPIVSISSDENMIYSQIKNLLECISLEKLKEETQEFGYYMHSPSKVALEFLEIINTDN